MVEVDRLDAQARKCRTLAGGLTNRDDIRALEELAREFEDRARRLRQNPASASVGVAA